MRTYMRFGELQGSRQPTTEQNRLGLHLLVEYAVRGGQPQGTVDQLVLEQCKRPRQPWHTGTEIEQNGHD